jgi:hypothetical protein
MKGEREPRELIAEDRESLWMLTISPLIWAAHFVLSYIGAAIWCGNLEDRRGALGPANSAIVGLSIVALIGISITGWRGWRRHKYGGGEKPYDKDTAEDRHRFLGYATVLLSALSAVAVVYSTLVAMVVRSCL